MYRVSIEFRNTNRSLGGREILWEQELTGVFPQLFRVLSNFRDSSSFLWSVSVEVVDFGVLASKQIFALEYSCFQLEFF